MQITNLRAGEKYETEKQSRQARGPSLGQFDRLASSRIGKPTPPFEQPSAATALLGARAASAHQAKERPSNSTYRPHFQRH